MTTERKALVLMTELLLGIRDGDATGFRRCLDAGLGELGLIAGEGLFLDQLLPVLTDAVCN